MKFGRKEQRKFVQYEQQGLRCTVVVGPTESTYLPRWELSAIPLTFRQVGVGGRRNCIPRRYELLGQGTGHWVPRYNAVAFRTYSPFLGGSMMTKLWEQMTTRSSRQGCLSIAISNLHHQPCILHTSQYLSRCTESTAISGLLLSFFTHMPQVCTVLQSPAT